MDATFFARFTLLLLASSACPANAKDDAAKDDVKSSFLLTPINLQTGVTDISTDIYTQLLARLTVPNFPPPKKSSWRDSLIKSMGGKSESRDISVGIRVKIADVEMPETTLVIYKMDSTSGKITSSVSEGKLFPRKRLDAGESISVNIYIRDIAKSQFDIKNIINAATSLVPGTSLVNELSKPYFTSITTLSNGILTDLNSQDVNSSYAIDMSPQASRTNAVDVEIRTADGTKFGTLQLSLLATTTATQEALPLKEFESTSRPLTTEDPGRLSFDINGIKRPFSTEIKSLPEYSLLLQRKNEDKSYESVSRYCKAATDYLDAKAGLTSIDRTHVLLKTMDEAGYNYKDNSSRWFDHCFDENDRASLLSSSSGRIKATAPDIASGKKISATTLDRLGCWMTGKMGDLCSAAGDALEADLLAQMDDDLTAFVDSTYLTSMTSPAIPGPEKNLLLYRLKDTADSFRCYGAGMLVQAKGRQDVFRLNGETRNGLITRLTISPAPASELDCRRAD